MKVLLKYQVNVNKQVSASKNKLSPLMMAAERGNLDMARLLVQSGAIVELLGQWNSCFYILNLSKTEYDPVSDCLTSAALQMLA